VSNLVWLSLSIVILFGGVVLIDVYRKRALAGIGAQPPAEDMAAALIRMEARIATLEQILDAEDPEWRRKAG
jgi:hypothetical protein